jgi:hypothetical protein
MEDVTLLRMKSGVSLLASLPIVPIGTVRIVGLGGPSEEPDDVLRRCCRAGGSSGIVCDAEWPQ